MSMNNVASMNPSLPAENAQCAAPASRWNQLAHLVGAHLAKLGTGRAIRHTKPGELLGVLDDLVRRGMVARSRGAWYRITDAGLLAFPSERCARWRQAFDMIWIDLDAQRARVCASLPRTDLDPSLGLCDSRPDAWACLFSHSEPCTPHRTPAEPFPTSTRRRVPVQVVRSVFTTNVAEFDGSQGETVPSIPSLEETIRRAPARELDGAHHYQQGYWPGIGMTDPWPATRIGYPGHEVRRVYA
jgi:hypothetical protein